MRRITKLVAGAVLVGAVVGAGANARATADATRCEIEPFSFPETVVYDGGNGNDKIDLEFATSASTTADCDGRLVEVAVTESATNLKLVRRGSSDDWKVRGPVHVTVATGDVNGDGYDDVSSFTTRATGSATGDAQGLRDFDIVLFTTLEDGREIELHQSGTLNLQANQIEIDVTSGFYEPWPTKG